MSSDSEKLLLALREIRNFASLDGILEYTGLGDMPPAQRYGILFGTVVFSLTIGTVLALLVLGGTFDRISEQEKARDEG
eukprot:CAMPEP_0183303602 /NCGR_PEP_ID=MMETSP0160_2-20130417/8975_1 /TAXON_ID=2839 ORGANISM="Odontella Sinensis, Strain Grunow 1884" /NCGR_SAMPLE_ID=MMETSP0160_2 /ASSEMBLY_ACC=CAM_ASM_000250 /LENGTH=78 /DNA_ID=CAMNT_0025466525 /DNA_START=275 /DNA_END=507 /DNA_ORIENTATION=+